MNPNMQFSERPQASQTPHFPGQESDVFRMGNTPFLPPTLQKAINPIEFYDTERTDQAGYREYRGGFNDIFVSVDEEPDEDEDDDGMQMG